MEGFNATLMYQFEHSSRWASGVLDPQGSAGNDIVTSLKRLVFVKLCAIYFNIFLFLLLSPVLFFPIYFVSFIGLFKLQMLSLTAFLGVCGQWLQCF